MIHLRVSSHSRARYVRGRGPGLNLPTTVRLTRMTNAIWRSGPKMLWPMRAQKMTASRNGSMNQEMQSFHVILSSTSNSGSP